MSEPKPVNIKVVCSECGLDWEEHGEKPTKDDCLRLLKAKLAHREATLNAGWGTVQSNAWWAERVSK